MCCVFFLYFFFKFILSYLTVILSLSLSLSRSPTLLLGNRPFFRTPQNPRYANPNYSEHTLISYHQQQPGQNGGGGGGGGLASGHHQQQQPLPLPPPPPHQSHGEPLSGDTSPNGGGPIECYTTVGAVVTSPSNSGGSVVATGADGGGLEMCHTQQQQTATFAQLNGSGYPAAQSPSGIYSAPPQSAGAYMVETAGVQNIIGKSWKSWKP